MCLNSSSPFNVTGSLFHQLLWCFYSRGGWYSGTALLSVNLLIVLPICVFVLYLGFQERHLDKISHTDAFTYHVAGILIVGVCASIISVTSMQLCNDTFVLIGIHMFIINFSAFLLFQCLMCGERYIAVVHPITYLHLKKKTLARNIICVFVWLQCIVQGFCTPYVEFSTLSFAFIFIGFAVVLGFILFCNISVLIALLRPPPGDGARKNKSTQRAFYTISAIFGTLVLKGTVDTVSNIISSSGQYSANTTCGLSLAAGWFGLPSQLILPLLYLHRTGKLPCYQRKQTNTTN